MMHLVLATAGMCVAGEAAPEPAWLKDLTVREGYKVTVAADDLPKARFLETDGGGRLFVSRPYAPATDDRKRIEAGDIVCLRDKDGDGVYETRETFVAGPVQLHGLCWQPDASGMPGAGWLWYTTSGSVRKARDRDGDGKADEDVEVIKEGDLPSGGAHWWRSILVAKDRLYTSIGDSGNTTDETMSDRQKIWSYALDGTGKKIFCAGIRNTEKLRLRPGTDEVWGLDHGSDWFGRQLGEDPSTPEKGQPITDANPAEEINHYVEGGFYGHPFVVGNRIPRYEFMNKSDIVQIANRTVMPELCMPAHWAGNGFAFMDPAIVDRTAGRPGAMPVDFAGDMVAAYHGSWNRTQPAGYCVVRVIFDQIEKRPIGYVKLVDGLKKLEEGKWQPVIRPVDVVQAADGSVLFSCDLLGKVLRIRTK